MISKISILLLSILFTTPTIAEERLLLMVTWSHDTKTAIPDGFKLAYSRDHITGGLIGKKIRGGFKLYESAGLVSYGKHGYAEIGTAFNKDFSFYTASGFLRDGLIVGLNTLGKKYGYSLGAYRTFKDVETPKYYPKKEKEHDDD